MSPRCLVVYTWYIHVYTLYIVTWLTGTRYGARFTHNSFNDSFHILFLSLTCPGTARDSAGVAERTARQDGRLGLLHTPS
jgi:hypothetical protein